jgi:hypothetical protein
LRRSAHFEEALKKADIYINKYEKDEFGYAAKGIILSSTYRAESGIQYFEKALQYSKNKALIYRNIAHAYLILNKFDESINNCTLAMHEDTRSYSSSMLCISNAYILKGNLTKARLFYEKANEKLDESAKALTEINDQNRTTAYSHAVIVSYQLDKNNDSLRYAEMMRSLNSDDLTKLSYATHLAKLGYKDKAIKEFASVDSSNCSFGSLAEYYLAIDDFKNAEKHFLLDYAQQKLPEQQSVWRLGFQRYKLYPHDPWSKARNQLWFKSLVKE